MKFELNAMEFKNAVDRAIAIISKKSSLQTLENLKITSGDDVIIISAVSEEPLTYVDITVSARIIDDGKVYVNKDNLRKVYGLSGSIIVKADAEKFRVKNEKKCCEVPTSNITDADYPEIPAIDDNVNCIFKSTEKELIETFVSMDCIRAKNSVKPLLEGFNINGEKRRIIACDTVKLAVKKIEGEFLDTDFNITVPGDACVNLKKVGNNKREHMINVYYGKPSGCTAYFVFFKGVDFTYCCKVLNGEYPSVDRVINVDKTYSFELCPEELENIAKEYSKNKETPMHIIKNKDKLYTAITTYGYQTADVLEKAGKFENVEDDFCFCVNPVYMKEVMSLFKDSKILAYGNTQSIASPMFFKNEEYEALILPMRKNKNIEKLCIDLINKL